MAAKRKCVICGECIENNDESVPYKGRHAHTSCFNVAMKVVVTEKKERLEKSNKISKRKPQKELREGLSEEEFQDKKKLCDFIRSRTHEELSIKVYKLMEDYRKKYKLSHQDMYDDLYWYFVIDNNPVEGDMIGIIPYIHDKAQQYYNMIRNAQKDCMNKMAQLNNMYPDKKIEIIKDSKVNLPQIDMTQFGGMKKNEQE